MTANLQMKFMLSSSEQIARGNFDIENIDVVLHSFEFLVTDTCDTMNKPYRCANQSKMSVHVIMNSQPV